MPGEGSGLSALGGDSLELIYINFHFAPLEFQD